MAQKFIEIDDITKRFGAVSLGSPVEVAVVGPTVLYAPAAGNRIRLKWFAMATSDTNSATVIATVYLGAQALYIWPLPIPGAFMHNSVREGGMDETLSISLSVDGQPVYCNIDLEEF